MIAIVAATLLGSVAVGHAPPSIQLQWPGGAAPGSLLRRRLGASSHSYSYMCEAGGTCAKPEAVAHDYFDAGVSVHARYYQVSLNATSGQRTQRTVNSTSLDTSKPTEYLIKFNAQDKAGNPAEEVVVSMIVRDSIKPTISLCTNSSSIIVEAAHNYTYCAPQAHDNIDGNISAPCTSAKARSCVATKLRFHGHYQDLSLEDLQSAGQFGPKDLTLKPGQWTFEYEAKDESGNVATAKMFIFVEDSHPPVITLHGDDHFELQCSETFKDPGATASDELDGDIDVRVYAGARRSCNDLKSNGHKESKLYKIQSPGVNDGKELEVWCDMETDGGGYTYYQVTDGISTNRYDMENTCSKLGLEIAVWRTEEHMHAMLHKYGTKYFTTAPGIYGHNAAGQSFAAYAMTSATPAVASKWFAVDGGAWFLRGSPYPQPSGDYQDGCWLGVNGFNPLRFNDDRCFYYTGEHYICSTNDKGGPGVLQQMQQSQISNNEVYPPAVPGNYTIVYQATDNHGLDAEPVQRNVEVYDDMAPTIHLQPFATGSQEISVLPELEVYEEYDPETDYLDPGASCSDSCSHNHVNLTESWDNRSTSLPLDPRKGGIYIKRYDCDDAFGNRATRSRSWVFVDAVGPLLALNGTTPTYVEACRTCQYVDPGARCTNSTNFYQMLANDASGEFDDKVVPSGVNLVKANRVGTYTVTYDCQVTDWDGVVFNAPSITRTVIVRDTTCVNLTLTVPKTEIIEAGFPYTPPLKENVVTAYDALDGELTSHVEVSGDTVSVGTAFVDRASCAQIKRDCDRANSRRAANATDFNVYCPSGEYWITVFPKGATGDAANGVRKKVYCDMDTDGGGYTIVPITNGKRISRFDDESSCDEWGMQLLVPRTKNHLKRVIEKYGKGKVALMPGIYGVSNETAHLKNYEFTSSVPEVAAVFRAVDGGSWWIGDDNSGRELKGDYWPGCFPEMYNWDLICSNPNDPATCDGFSFKDCQNSGGCYAEKTCPKSTDAYLCSTNDFDPNFDVDSPTPWSPACKDLDRTRNPPVCHIPDHMTIPVFDLSTRAAQPGVYVITYSVTDINKNRECSPTTRTVVVKDTLKPQITLHLDVEGSERAVQRSGLGSYRGIRDVADNVIGNDNLGQFYKTSTQNGKLVPWTALGLEPVVHVTGNHNDYGGRRRRLIDGTENVDGADVERKWRSTLVRSALGSAVFIAGVALVILASEYSKRRRVPTSDSDVQV